MLIARCMRTYLLLMTVVMGCGVSDSEEGGVRGAGGKADGDEADAGAAVERRMLAGSCSVSVTEFRGGYGRPRTSEERISLDVRIDEVAEDGAAKGSVHVASPWGDVPDELWRGWCHIARGDLQPASSACVVAPFDIATAALGFGEGWTSFRAVDEGFELYVSAGYEEGRDSYFDTEFTKTRVSCSLR
jgi:hypothetical protein